MAERGEVNLTYAFDRTERTARLAAIRQWGVSANAEATAQHIVDALPPSTPPFGIFPTGHDDDGEHGDGGLMFQRFTALGGVIVHVNAEGAIHDSYEVNEARTLTEYTSMTANEAAAFIAG